MFAGRGLDEPVVVPWLFRLLRRLDLEKIRIVDFATIFAQSPLTEDNIVGWNLLHFGEHRRAVRLGGVDAEHSDRLEIMEHTGIAADLDRARLRAVNLRCIALGKAPRRVVEVPVESF